MKHRCRNCGAFTSRLHEGVGLPLVTCFPGDRPMTASTFPWALFVCKKCEDYSPGKRAQYDPIDWSEVIPQSG